MKTQMILVMAWCAVLLVGICATHAVAEEKVTRAFLEQQYKDMNAMIDILEQKSKEMGSKTLILRAQLMRRQVAQLKERHFSLLGMDNDLILEELIEVFSRLEDLVRRVQED